MIEQMQTIESLDLSLDQIFNDFYVVPSFQREYVWTETEVEQLLSDIYDEFSDSETGSSEYFIGSLVVCPGNDGVLELIDGQQRMTTTYLFLCVIRDYLHAKDIKIPDRLSFQIAATNINDAGDEIFHYRVNLQYDDSTGVLEQIARDGMPQQIIAETRSTVNIKNAYQTIFTFIESEFGDDIAEIRRFYAYFINHVKLVRIKTQSVTHALKVFETINDRGVGLDSMDLLKNLMFIQADREQFDVLKNRWKELVDILFKAKEKPLRFLRYFIFANYDVDRLKEDQIYNWFTRNNALCGYLDDPIGYVDKLVNSARAYTAFVRGLNTDGTVNRYLKNLGYLSGAARQHLILLLAGSHLPQQDFIELCRQLENLFFVYIITREPTKEFERRFARWATNVRAIRNTTDLETFIEAQVAPAKKNLTQRYELAMRELRSTSIQKYRLRYVLGKFAQYINEQAYRTDESADLGAFINNKVEIEHILPQIFSPELLKNISETNEDVEELRSYVERLGNLTLLEKSINSSIGNGLYKIKRNAYSQSNLLLTKTLATEVKIGSNTAIDRAVRDLITFEKWDGKSIDQRQEMLTKLSKRVWDMQ